MQINVYRVLIGPTELALMAGITSTMETICNLFTVYMDLSSAIHENEVISRPWLAPHLSQSTAIVTTILRYLHFEVSDIFFQMALAESLPFLKSLLRFKNT